MKIAEGKDVSLGIFDIETLAGMIDIGVYDPDKGEWNEFEISKEVNDLYRFISFYESGCYDYWVGFNSIGFDHQVLQFVIQNYNDWFDLEGHEISEKVYEFVQRLIDDQKYDIQPLYKESDFPVKPIDVFRIHHFDNENRRTSLKWCAFMMNLDVEEMPIHHSTKILTQADKDIIKNYRRNDVMVTKAMLELTLGITSVPELSDYVGKNKIQDRFDIMKETGMECLNWSDVKIGEEWNKLDYKAGLKLENDWDLYPKKAVHPYGKKMRHFFPKTSVYSTQKLLEFRKEFGENYVTAKSQEWEIEVGTTKYTIAKGGIHSNESYRNIVVPKGLILRDADVGSQYPKFIEKNEIFPPHLQRNIIDQFKGKIQKRIVYKDIATDLKNKGQHDKARPYTSIQGMMKLCLNGGYYGKLNQKGSFLEYPEGQLKVTIGCQMEILLLIEMMEEAGIRVISGNTDGIVSIFREDQEDKYKEVCAEWETKVGNHDLGKLEYTDFSGLWQESVNSYIAKKKKDGTIKKKGRFVTNYGEPGCEINKNKSKRIIALALENYFIYGKNPIDFITNHQNIFDFCIAKKAFGNLHYEEILDEDNVIKHKKLIRYYVSNSGNVFMKRGLNNEGNPMNNHCEAIDKDFPWMGQPKLKYFNKVIEYQDFSEYDIDYSYYILDTLKRIDKIEKTGKAKIYADRFKTEQTSLF